MSAPSDRVGTELVGYRIRGLLGRGGMGVVYLADQIALGRAVALKILAPELVEDDRFRARFLSESRLAASIEHPHIVPIYDAGEAEGLLYIAMRYVEGADLRTVIRREGALDVRRAVDIVGQVAGALDAAHERGLVHRDVKSRNVLIAREGSGDHCFLCDFGLVKTTSSESSVGGRGQLVGTIEYIAPEQIEGGTVDARADVYSLGCLLYECLTGEVPFRRDTEVAVIYGHLIELPKPPSSVRPELPHGFDGVVAKALAKPPKERYRRCGELAQAAVAAAGGDAVEGRRRFPRRLGRRRNALVVAAAAVLAAALALGLVLRGGRSAPEASASATFVGATPASGKGLKLGYIALGERMPFVHLVSQSIRQQAKIAGAKLVFCDAAFKWVRAVDCARSFKQQHVDAYLNYDADQSASPRICAAGPPVPVIAIDIHQNPCERAFMGIDNADAGYISGRALGVYFRRTFDCNYDAFVSLESSRTGIVNEERMGGYRRGFSSVCGTISHFRKLNAYDTVVAQRMFPRVLRALPHRHRIIVVGINDDAVVGALAAAKRAGRKRDLFVSGQGASPFAWCEIAHNSHWIAETAYFPERYGEIAVPYLIRLIRHEQVPQFLYVPHVVLTAKNLSDYYRPTGC
jgi:ribose transport system substrate-binding protein